MELTNSEKKFTEIIRIILSNSPLLTDQSENNLTLPGKSLCYEYITFVKKQMIVFRVYMI